MDTIFIGDIPSNYKYAKFYNDYIDLFSQPNVEGSLDYYRIHLYDNLFEYEHLTGNFNEFNTFTAVEVPVSSDWHYRRDLPSICFLGVVEISVIIILFNLVSSVFKKGGILSGLL